MTLTLKNDRWYVKWTAHVHNSRRAADWCQEMFDSGWGEYAEGPVGGTGIGSHEFWFYRGTHATWFMLKWASI